MKAILYPHEGHLAVTAGVADADSERIALLVTPISVPYLIVDESELPLDDLYFNAWTADFSDPAGMGVGREAYDLLYPSADTAIQASVEYVHPPQPSPPEPEEEELS